MLKIDDLKAFEINIDKINNQQWEQLFKLIPIIARTKRFGKSISEKLPDGSQSFPYIEKSKIVNQFYYTVYEIGVMQSFDWPNWNEGRNLLSNPKTDFNKLDIKTLCMLIKAIVRNDRFCEGALVNAFEHGVMLKIIRALKFNIEKKTNNYKKPKITKSTNTNNLKIKVVQASKSKTKPMSITKKKE